MNKPVAWMGLTAHNQNRVSIEKLANDDIPLYTHPVKEEAEQQSYQEADGCPTELAVLKRFWRQHNPVKEQDCYGDGNVYRGVRSKDSEIQTIHFNPVKELTDEEIAQAWAETKGDMLHRLMPFARAILRKAQEK